MARSDFGGTTADFTFTIGSANVMSIAPSAVLTFWSAPTGGTRYTDLIVNGSAATSVTSDAYGNVPQFQGPDGITSMWADGGGGERVRFNTSDGPTDGTVAGYASTTGSATKAVLDGAYGRLSAVAAGGVATISTDTTATIGKANRVDASASARSITIPDGANAGDILVAEKYDSTTNTVSLTGKIRSTTSATFTLTYQYETIAFVWSGTYWEPAFGHRTKASIDTQIAKLKVWAANPDNLVSGTITRDSNGAALSASVTWPDGTTGTYTADTVSSTFPGAVDAYHITYGSPVTMTVTQPAVTRSSSGAVTNRPALVVS